MSNSFNINQEQSRHHHHEFADNDNDDDNTADADDASLMLGNVMGSSNERINYNNNNNNNNNRDSDNDAANYDYGHTSERSMNSSMHSERTGFSSGTTVNGSSHAGNNANNGSGGGNNNATNDNGMLEKAERGDKIISASRCIFFSVLFIAAAVLATVAYILYRQEEIQNFQRSFINQAEEIALYTNHNVDTAFATLRGLSTVTTSLVKRTSYETGLPLGFVNIPDIQYNLNLAKNTTDALVIAYMPKVLNKDYNAWLNYSQTNKYWISEEQEEEENQKYYYNNNSSSSSSSSSSINDAVEPIITPYIWEYSSNNNEPNFTKEGVDYYDEVQHSNSNSNSNSNISDGSDSDGSGDDDGNNNPTTDTAETNAADTATRHQRNLLLRGGATGTNNIATVASAATVTSASASAASGSSRSLLQKSTDCSGDHFKNSDRRRELRKLYRELQSINSNNNNNSSNEYYLQDNNTQSIDEKIEIIKDLIATNKDIPEIKSPSSRDAAFYAPVWQMVPVPIINVTHPNAEIINYNLVDRPVFLKAVDYMATTRLPTFLDVCDQSAWFLIDDNKDILQTVVAFPVFADFLPDSEVAGFFAAIIPWIEFFDNQLVDSSNNITIVMENTCDEVFTINIAGGSETNVFILGEEDLHDPQYDSIKFVAPFAPEYNRDDVDTYKGEVCVYTMTIYPTKSFEDAYFTNRPKIISMLIVLVFLSTSLAFMLFDCLVTRRQAQLLNTALRQNAIVSSLFPSSVQKKLMEEAEVETASDLKNKKNLANRRSIGAALNGDGNIMDRAITLDSKPIADLFPKTTIMFADISGFTAWSSAREPEAVFTLLETIYRAFDMVAKRRRVFKVEVVGDCYVAVCGLPDPRKDHFSVMCRFAQDCLNAMQTLTKELEVTLGPDTGDLMLRVGLHSGPVVAGVLRGEKSRFQLFGDTMNTASRMESTGVPNRIQLSQSTADLLIEAGKEHWMIKREDKVKAKGKGELTTFFLLSKNRRRNSSVRDEVTLGHESDAADNKSGNPTANGVKRVQKRNRVADWVVEMLDKLLKEMKAKRELTGIKPDSQEMIEALESQTGGEHDGSINFTNDTVIDEVADVLKLPVYAANIVGSADTSSKKTTAPLDQDVMDELKDYVYSIASMYNKNPFHNFEHASHVSMSCIKLLNRIASRDENYQDGTDHTYGICSDPLTSFAIVFSALIHDVDHTGAPNVQLVKEHSPVASTYKNKSVAEQNSIDVGWGLLMEPSYAKLRRHIYTTVSEYRCFRQLVVNAVMATDICDKDLIKARNQRWDLAFSTPNNSSSLDDSSKIANNPGSRFESVRQVNNRKGTVVIEHLIQLSDVAHTMQHWHIYRRWNERLFEESYVAYAECRSDNNPADNWYKGEIGFFDFYIIPLAQKIKQCQVFGVSSDEYLSYALQNRVEWEERGKELVEEMSKKMDAIHNAGISRQLLQLEMAVEISGQSQNEMK